MTYIIHCPKPNPRPGERWTHVHEPDPVHLEDIPDEDTDVFESVSEFETERLDYSNLNLAGTRIMTKNTLASALSTVLATGKVHVVNDQGHSYFDPIDVVEDHLGVNSVMLAKSTNSIAWNLDMACLNQARTVLYERYAEADKSEPEQGINLFDLFCLGIVEDLSHASLYEQEGSSEQTLAQLLALRTQWHSAAQAAASRNDKDYNPKSLQQMLIEEKPRTAQLGERANLKVIAKYEAKGDAAKEARLLESYILASEVQAQQRTENNKKLIPTITLIVTTAERYASADTRFDMLPKSVQTKLTEQAIKTINRIKMDVAKTMANEPIAFGHVIEAAYSCTEALTKVLQSKFGKADELEYAGMPPGVTQFDRNQKRVACTVEDAPY